MKKFKLDLEPLLTWFSASKRDLPWRKNKSFYRVWISEVMLQQTQVATVIPYYERFLQTFPTLQALAEAELDHVLKLWEGLGYYSRARNMHKAAIELNACKALPTSYEELIGFSGFGPYTTAAVLSFVYNAPHAVVDGNVKRVIARLFSLEDDISSVATKAKIQAIVDQLLPSGQSAIFNEAIMELGATICTPKNTQCSVCPLQTQCMAAAQGRVADLPKRQKRKRVPTRKMDCVLLVHKDEVLVEQRGTSEMLGGLWRFPQESEIQAKRKKMRLVKHTYSHFKLELQPYFLNVSSTQRKAVNGTWVHFSELKHLAFDKASLLIIDEFMERYA
jgi:A/G-specific adenine glycosylase